MRPRRVHSTLVGLLAGLSLSVVGAVIMWIAMFNDWRIKLSFNVFYEEWIEFVGIHLFIPLFLYALWVWSKEHQELPFTDDDEE